MKKQCKRLLDYLQAGNVITTLDGWQALGIYAVSQRIGDLVKDGYPINKAWKTIHNRYGEPQRVRCYWMTKDNISASLFKDMWVGKPPCTEEELVKVIDNAKLMLDK